jgi:hypothetical protein
MPKLRKGDVVSVIWEDAWSNSRWQNAPPADVDGISVELVGFLVQQNKHGIFVSAGRALNDSSLEWVDMHYVPKGMVRKVKVLRRCLKQSQ